MSYWDVGFLALGMRCLSERRHGLQRWCAGRYGLARLLFDGLCVAHHVYQRLKRVRRAHAEMP